MKIRFGSLIVVLLCLMGSVAGAAGTSDSNGATTAETTRGPLTLFGVELHGATRDEFRKVIKEHGLVPTDLNDKRWWDEYDPDSVMEGASAFEPYYSLETGKFAIAVYTFPSSMDINQVFEIEQMVATKYGPADQFHGTGGVGPVRFVWNFPNNMTVNVSRGWPDTTTYLSYADTDTMEKAKSEARAFTRSKREEEVKSLGDAL